MFYTRMSLNSNYEPLTILWGAGDFFSVINMILRILIRKFFLIIIFKNSFKVDKTSFISWCERFRILLGADPLMSLRNEAFSYMIVSCLFYLFSELTFFSTFFKILLNSKPEIISEVSTM